MTSTFSTTDRDPSGMTADESADYETAYQAAVADAVDYLDGRVRNVGDLVAFAHQLVGAAFENGYALGGPVNCELPARYSLTGHPIPFTV